MIFLLVEGLPTSVKCNKAEHNKMPLGRVGWASFPNEYYESRILAGNQGVGSLVCPEHSVVCFNSEN